MCLEPEILLVDEVLAVGDVAKAREGRQSLGGSIMLLDYIQAALERAHYEIIEDEEPFYGEVPSLAGVWATGKTLEECRRNLAEAIEDWVLFSIAKGLPIPALGQVAIHLPERVLA